MSRHQEPRAAPAEGPARDLSRQELTDKQRDELDDAAKQEQYRKAYLEQLRARDCPGCGDADLF